MTSAPITVTPAAEERLRRSLASTKEDMEASLVWCPSSHGFTADGKLSTFWEGPRVVLGWYKKGQRPSDSFFDLLGYAVSIMPTTLEHIAGKSVDLQKVEMEFEDGPRYEWVFKVV